MLVLIIQEENFNFVHFILKKKIYLQKQKINIQIWNLNIIEKDDSNSRPQINKAKHLHIFVYSFYNISPLDFTNYNMKIFY